MFFGKMKIGARLGAGFGVVIAMLVALAVIGLYNFSNINSQFELVVNVNNNKIALANEVRGAIDNITFLISEIAVSRDPAARANAMKKINETRVAYKKAMDELKRGDKVVTIGGLKGEISKLGDDTMTLKVSDNTEIVFVRKALAYKEED